MHPVTGNSNGKQNLECYFCTKPKRNRNEIYLTHDPAENVTAALAPPKTAHGHGRWKVENKDTQASDHCAAGRIALCAGSERRKEGVVVCAGGSAVPADWDFTTQRVGSAEVRVGGKRDAGTAEPVRKGHRGSERDPGRPERKREKQGREGGAKKDAYRKVRRAQKETLRWMVSTFKEKSVTGGRVACLPLRAARKLPALSSHFGNRVIDIEHILTSNYIEIQSNVTSTTTRGRLLPSQTLLRNFPTDTLGTCILQILFKLLDFGKGISTKGDLDKQGNPRSNVQMFINIRQPHLPLHH
ncbi:hypothetical protein B0H11DRAFT_1915254 [Mycena galericulata]|nr:hypothetical protein B0H11DRAFT_1915254 [Mycena galericulata]